MKPKQDFWIDKGRPETGADTVEYCQIPVFGKPCMSPVVKGGLEAHRERIHSSPLMPSVPVGRWEREWHQ